MKKKILIIIAALLTIFIIINAAWTIWRKSTYDPYTSGMEYYKVDMHITDAIVPRYTYKDPDGFDYSVKYPEYLSFVGNLAVGFPGTDEDPFTDGLIIWPKYNGGYEFGIMLNPKEPDSEGWMFYIDAYGNAIDPEYRPIAVEYSDVITELLNRAFTFWNIKEDAA